MRDPEQPGAGLGVAAHLRHLGEEALGPDEEHREEDEMAGKEGEADIDLATEGLGDAEEDATGKRSPQTAEPADDHRLEAENEEDRSEKRIEVHADRDEDAGHGDDHQG